MTAGQGSHAQFGPAHGARVRTPVVDIDIQPGTYRSAGGIGGRDCHWARLNSLNTSDIINNNRSPGPQAVEIQPSDKAFSTDNCQQWQKAS
jgi:hypothetical protein